MYVNTSIKKIKNDIIYLTKITELRVRDGYYVG